MIVVLFGVLLQASSGSYERVYESEALRVLVEGAAVSNRNIPDVVRGYVGVFESELSTGARDSAGVEGFHRIEQIGGRIRWVRGYPLMAQVERRRSAAATSLVHEIFTFSSPWVVSTLYGEEILLANARTQERLSDSAAIDRIRILHPLREDRATNYTFSGGDTVVTMSIDGRRLPIVRVRVRPRVPASNELLFDGEIHLDASRLHIVRMRGRVILPPLSQGTSRNPIGRLVGWSLSTYIDVICAEIDGDVWLPVYQRADVSVGAAATGPTVMIGRTVTRIVGVTRLSEQEADSLAAMRQAHGGEQHRESWRGSAWLLPLGSASHAANLDDYGDLWPEQRAPVRGVRVSAFPSDLSRLVRYNRIEGLFTGGELTATSRIGEHRLVLRVGAGWAWSEKVARGEVGGAVDKGIVRVNLRAHRSLISTSDFTRIAAPFNDLHVSDTQSLELGDYVDRRGVTASLVRTSGRARDIQWLLGLARLTDAPVVANILSERRKGRDVLLPENRWAQPGSYLRVASDVVRRPDLWSGAAGRGMGLRGHHETAVGGMRWDRSELSALIRGGRNRFGVALRADAGIVLAADIPPQSLFEMGGAGSTLTGYSYKEFSGDRAASARSFVNYALPMLEQRPRYGTVRLPALRPGVGVGAQAGWTRLSTDEARRAATMLTSTWSEPLDPRDTGGVLGSMLGGVTFFGGSWCACIARPFGRGHPWVFRLTGGLGM